MDTPGGASTPLSPVGAEIAAAKDALQAFRDSTLSTISPSVAGRFSPARSTAPTLTTPRGVGTPRQMSAHNRALWAQLEEQAFQEQLAAQAASFQEKALRLSLSDLEVRVVTLESNGMQSSLHASQLAQLTQSIADGHQSLLTRLDRLEAEMEAESEERRAAHVAQACASLAADGSVSSLPGLWPIAEDADDCGQCSTVHVLQTHARVLASCRDAHCAQAAALDDLFSQMKHMDALREHDAGRLDERLAESAQAIPQIEERLNALASSVQGSRHAADVLECLNQASGPSQPQAGQLGEDSARHLPRRPPAPVPSPAQGLPIEVVVGQHGEAEVEKDRFTAKVAHMHRQLAFIEEAIDKQVMPDIWQVQQQAQDAVTKVDRFLLEQGSHAERIEERDTRFGIAISRLDAHEQKLQVCMDRMERVPTPGQMRTAWREELTQHLQGINVEFLARQLDLQAQGLEELADKFSKHLHTLHADGMTIRLEAQARLVEQLENRVQTLCCSFARQSV